MTDTTDQRPPDTIVKRPATWSPIFASTMDLSAVRGANFVAVGTWIRVERDVRDVLTNEVVVAAGEYVDWNTAVSFGYVKGEREEHRNEHTDHLDAERRQDGALEVETVDGVTTASVDFSTLGGSGSVTVVIDGSGDEPPSAALVRRHLGAAIDKAFTTYARSIR